MAWESGKSQLMKMLGLVVIVFGIISFMMLSYFFIPYSDIGDYIQWNLIADIFSILTLLFVINYRVWRFLSGKTFYGFEIYDPDGNINDVLWERQAYFEVDMERIEDQLDERQRKILTENELAIKKLKRGIREMQEIKEKRDREEKIKKAKMAKIAKKKKLLQTLLASKLRRESGQPKPEKQSKKKTKMDGLRDRLQRRRSKGKDEQRDLPELSDEAAKQLLDELDQETNEGDDESGE